MASSMAGVPDVLLGPAFTAVASTALLICLVASWALAMVEMKTDRLHDTVMPLRSGSVAILAQVRIWAQVLKSLLCFSPTHRGQTFAEAFSAALESVARLLP
uniref:Uncharacterized protein n=1 Tax=Prorocentrum micans TaxID=2945 RepID=A0A7S2TCP4_PROMC|mmetsp:Transcript_3722/g.2935  ORF Transcript_3722/g.2935 Transcript_3722/m.2935 type:complete len:102 (+) Transcript_3722:155-460(+)